MIKRLTIIIVLISVTALLKAQINSIPNAGFENWTSMGSYEVPNQWGNLNASTASTGVFTVVKSSPGSPGNHYIRLITKNAGGVLTPGIIVSGELDPVTQRPLSGFPFNQQVRSLRGKYQYMGYGTNVATFEAWLTRWDAFNMRRDTVASLHHNTTGMIHVWTPFSFPFTYNSTELPDTAIIFISSSSETPVSNSFVWLDDLGFEGTVTASEDIAASSGISIYPCPATDHINVEFNSLNGYTALLKVIDSKGLTVLKTTADVSTGFNQLNIKLSEYNLQPGLYYLQINTPEGTFTEKFIVSG